MTLNVFEWHKDERRPINLHHSQHVCKNKEKLTKFLEENTVPPVGGILVHPWTGTNAITFPFQARLANVKFRPESLLDSVYRNNALGTLFV